MLKIKKFLINQTQSDTLAQRSSNCEIEDGMKARKNSSMPPARRYERKSYYERRKKNSRPEQMMPADNLLPKTAGRDEDERRIFVNTALNHVLHCIFFFAGVGILSSSKYTQIK